MRFAWAITFAHLAISRCVCAPSSAGLLARLALYLAVARGIFRLYKQSEGEEKEILAALFASAAVLIFMMSNVLIYSKQLNFLFGAIAALSFALSPSKAATTPSAGPPELNISEDL